MGALALHRVRKFATRLSFFATISASMLPAAAVYGQVRIGASIPPRLTRIACGVTAGKIIYRSSGQSRLDLGRQAECRVTD